MGRRRPLARKNRDMGTISPIGPILLLLLIGGGLYLLYARRTGKGADISIMLDNFGTVVFVLLFLVGVRSLFDRSMPLNILFPEAQMGALGLTLFSLFGLLIARGLAVLISIERAAHGLIASPSITQNAE